MFKLLGFLCVLGVARTIPIPDDDDFRYAYTFNNVNPSVQTYSGVNAVAQPAVGFAAPTFKVNDDSFEVDNDFQRYFYAAQPQTMEVRQPAVVNNVQPNTYSANIFRVDDDRYDFDDDDIRFLPVAQPQQPTVMTYSANTGVEQPITKTAEVASETRPLQQLTARSMPTTYQQIVVDHDFDDDVSGEVFHSFTPTNNVNRAIVYSGIRDQSGVQTYSAVNALAQPAVGFAAPTFKVNDDSFEVDDDFQRYFYAAQPQTMEVRQPAVVNNVQPNTYSANIFRVDDDRYDFDDDDIRFLPVAQPQQPTVMTYSANTGVEQPFTKIAEVASETRPLQQRTARSMPTTYQQLVVDHDFDDDVSGEVFHSFTPTNNVNRAIVYSGIRDQSGEFEDFNDAYRKAYFVSV